MFSRRSVNWEGYEEDILGFCKLLEWEPSAEAADVLRQVQRGYRRVGITGLQDGRRVLGAASLWLACCFPDRLQLVIAGPTRTGTAWVKFLAGMSSHARSVVRQYLLFTEGHHSVYVPGADEPTISVLSPSLVSGIFARLIPGRPEIVVMPDLDKVPTRWLPSVQALVSGPNDQWLLVATPR